MWDLAQRLEGQLRLSPRGQVIGLDLRAALALGTALGIAPRAVAELMPALEAGMVSALAERMNQDHDHDG